MNDQEKKQRNIFLANLSLKYSKITALTEQMECEKLKLNSYLEAGNHVKIQEIQETIANISKMLANLNKEIEKEREKNN